MADRTGKTEQPTQRRLEKARKEGQYASAKEFVAALQFMVFLALLGAFGAHWLDSFRWSTRDLFALAFAGDLGVQDLTRLAWRLFWHHFLPLVLGGMAVAAATVALRLATTRFGLSLKKLAPDLKRLNPLNRLR